MFFKDVYILEELQAEQAKVTISSVSYVYRLDGSGSVCNEIQMLSSGGCGYKSRYYVVAILWV